MRYASHLFACAIREQEWSFPSGELREERLEWGEAQSRWESGWTISASDRPGTTGGPYRLDGEAIEWLRTIPAAVATGAEGVVSLRIVTQRRIVVSGTESDRSETSLAIATIGDGSGSLICDAAELTGRLRARSLHGAPRRERSGELPLVFRNGTASLLFHEAVGHAVEEGLGAEVFPPWLTVRDEPLQRRDDTGAITAVRDLRTSAPASLRRWSFRDIPLPRMSRVSVGVSRSAELPARRIEVLHAEEGTFDVLSGELTVTVPLAYEVDGASPERVAPFLLRLTRDELAARLSGAVSTDRTAHLVICGAHGQRLPVAGESPDILVEASR